MVLQFPWIGCPDCTPELLSVAFRSSTTGPRVLRPCMMGVPNISTIPVCFCLLFIVYKSQ